MKESPVSYTISRIAKIFILLDLSPHWIAELLWKYRKHFIRIWNEKNDIK